MVCLPNFSKISDAKLQKLKDLENELGVILVAFEPMPYADLSSDQLKELKKMEKNLGAKVVAYR